MVVPFPKKLDTSPEHLVRLLEQLDINNTDLAKLAGVDRTTVVRWVHGHMPIQHSVVRFLEMTLEVKQLAGRCRVYWNEPGPAPSLEDER